MTAMTTLLWCFIDQYILYFTLAFSITFYVGAYFTEQ